jgi:hypothetical protein
MADFFWLAAGFFVGVVWARLGLPSFRSGFLYGRSAFGFEANAEIGGPGGPINGRIF